MEHLSARGCLQKHNESNELSGVLTMKNRKQFLKGTAQPIKSRDGANSEAGNIVKLPDVFDADI